MDQETEHSHVIKASISLHFAALASALNEQLPGLVDSFDTNLMKVILDLDDAEAENEEVNNVPTKEVIQWTRHLLNKLS